MAQTPQESLRNLRNRNRRLQNNTYRSTLPPGEIIPPGWVEPPTEGRSCVAKFLCNGVEHPNFPPGHPLPFSPQDKSCAELEGLARSWCKKNLSAAEPYLAESGECCGWDDWSGGSCSDCPTCTTCPCFCCECKDLRDGCWVWNPETLANEWLNDPNHPLCTGYDVPGEIAKGPFAGGGISEGF